MLYTKALDTTDRALAAGLAAAFLGLYGATLCPTVYWYDSAEFVTASAVLGIAHPPGYPLYTLIGHAFTWLPLEDAVAVNAMSAVFAAIAVGLTFAIVRLIGASRLGSLVAAATLGGSGLFWANASIAEVYCPALAGIAVVVGVLLAARHRGSTQLFCRAAFLAGLFLGLHLSIATCGLGFALLVWAGRDAEVRALWRRDLLRPRLVRSASALVSTLSGTLIFLYVPLRAAMKPPLNLGDPSTWERFRWHVTGGNYRALFVDVDVLDRTLVIAGYLHDQLLVVGLLLAAVGACVLARRQPVVLLSLLSMIAGNIYSFFDYQAHDLEVFFLPTTLVLSWFVGFGVDGSIEGARRLAHARAPRLFSRSIAAALILFPLALIVTNYEAVDLSDFDETDRFAAEIVKRLPQNATLVNFTSPEEWKLDAVFGMYLQNAHGIRTDVRIGRPYPLEIVRDLQSGERRVFAYAALPRLQRAFVLRPVGHYLYEIVAVRGDWPRRFMRPERDQASPRHAPRHP